MKSDNKIDQSMIIELISWSFHCRWTCYKWCFSKY